MCIHVFTCMHIFIRSLHRQRQKFDCIISYVIKKILDRRNLLQVPVIRKFPRFATTSDRARQFRQPRFADGDDEISKFKIF